MSKIENNKTKLYIDSSKLEKIIKIKFNEMVNDKVMQDSVVIGDIDNIKISLVITSGGPMHPISYINDNIVVVGDFS